MVRHGFIVLFVFFAVLANGFTVLPNFASDSANYSILVVASFEEPGDAGENEEGDAVPVNSKLVEHACSHAHQLWPGSLPTFRLAASSCSLKNRIIRDVAWFGSEPAPILEPPAA